MKCQIQGHAPTVYQSSSISRFGIPVEKNPGGYWVRKSFDTVGDAIDHLNSAADRYYEDPKELMQARHDIKHNRLLTIDAVTCHIITDPAQFQDETKL